tara:strand:- start:435 stop:1313 length:879 start_codon:yes stop_codon:yes gene_type:complete
MEKEKAVALNNEGARHFLNQSFVKAEECYLKAYAIDPDNISLLNNMGLFYQQQKSISKAINYFEKAIAITVKPHFLVNLGNALSMDGNYELAWKKYLEASERFPEHENAKVSMAKLATHIGKLDQAVHLYQSILESNPSEKHKVQLVKVYMKMKAWEKAIQLLNTLDFDGGEGELWFLVGQCELQLKNFGLALKYFKSALAEEPDNTSFRHYLAITYLGMGNVEDGLDQLKKNERLAPENPAILTDIGIVYLSKGDVETASNYLKKALNIAPDFKKALYYKSQMNSAQQKQN